MVFYAKKFPGRSIDAAIPRLVRRVITCVQRQDVVKALRYCSRLSTRESGSRMLCTLGGGA